MSPMTNGSVDAKRASRSRRAMAVGLASAALGACLSFAGAGTSVAAPPPPPAPAPVSGSDAHPQQPPAFMVDAIRLWEQIGWPNATNIGNREWVNAGSFVNPSTHQRVNELLFTGGTYNDRDGSLRRFMNTGGAGPSSVNAGGAFQEYNTTVYHVPENSNIPGRDTNRIVRNIRTGDVFWTTDHYKSFHYMGRH
ncbi:hypothetical protein [Kitasatospora cathayae]